MSRQAAKKLAELERIVRSYGPGFARAKETRVRELSDATLTGGPAVARLHEALCFLRAYPDDERVLEVVTRALDAFDAREDLRRHRGELDASGIAGTRLRDQFHWVTARWLTSKWPERLRIDWALVEDHGALDRMLPRLLGWAEAVEAGATRARLARYLRLFEQRDEVDGSFLVRRFAGLSVDEPLREHLFESLALPMILEPGPGGPSRTRAYLPSAPRAFQTRPLDRSRPDLRRASRVEPRSVRRLEGAEATAVLELAREAMITRTRDLDAIKHASPDDVRLVDTGDGLAFACLGVSPEQRSLIEALYVFLLLKNGVPIGYYQAALSFGAAELNFNVFPPWRGAEAARLYARAVAVVRALFGVDVLAVPPYQLGHENDEALASGAYWFYAKLGLRPRDQGARALLRDELAAMKANPLHRSSRAVLRKLAAHYVYLDLGAERDDVPGRVSFDEIARAVSRHLNERFGSDRERGLRACAREAARLLDAKPSGWTAGERLAWERWSPLVVTLGDVGSWPAAERRALVATIRAKGGPREDEYAARFARHGRLRRALLDLAGGDGARPL